MFQRGHQKKFNYEKTKGLWLGNWKDRTDTPLGITWTNSNVKTLGVYFGNENPAAHTFADIVPKVTRSLNYWKQLKLSKLSKARVIEILLASRFWYFAIFYPISIKTTKELQAKFKEYVNFPGNPTVSESEMKKTQITRGLKANRYSDQIPHF